VVDSVDWFAADCFLLSPRQCKVFISASPDLEHTSRAQSPKLSLFFEHRLEAIGGVMLSLLEVKPYSNPVDY
jgi:hypothetical protein